MSAITAKWGKWIMTPYLRYASMYAVTFGPRTAATKSFHIITRKAGFDLTHRSWCCRWQHVRTVAVRDKGCSKGWASYCRQDLFHHGLDYTSLQQFYWKGIIKMFCFFHCFWQSHLHFYLVCVLLYCKMCQWLKCTSLSQKVDLTPTSWFRYSLASFICFYKLL